MNRLATAYKDKIISGKDAFQLAAYDGDRDTIELLMKEGVRATPYVCKAAACGGHLKLLIWLIERGFPPVEVMAGATRGKQYHILEWILENHPDSRRPQCIGVAAETGDPEILQWHFDAGTPLDRTAWYGAIASKSKKVLEWLLQKRCPWDESVFVAVVNSGDLELVKWFQEKGCPWNELACSTAAKHGDIKVLKWLHQNGCPWDWRTYKHLSKRDPEVAKWALQEGCPTDGESSSSS